MNGAGKDNQQRDRVIANNEAARQSATPRRGFRREAKAALLELVQGLLRRDSAVRQATAPDARNAFIAASS